MAATLHTAEWLAEHPEIRAELVRGQLRPVSPAGHRHGAIAMNIGAHLHAFVREHRRGRIYAAETGFVIERGPDTVRAPDVAFVAEPERIRGGTTTFGEGAPELVVEVISPSDTHSEIEDKIAQWLAAGCKAAILVDPDRAVVQVRRADGSNIELRESSDTVVEVPDILPGWSIRLAELFES